MKLNLGNNICKFRREKELAQEQFAEYLGVSPKAVSRWENSTTFFAIEYFAIVEDEDKIDDLMREYATERDFSKEALLHYRYVKLGTKKKLNNSIEKDRQEKLLPVFFTVKSRTNDC